MVQEFYASLKEYEAKKLLDEPWLYVTLRGKDILISRQKICSFYNIPLYMYDFI